MDESPSSAPSAWAFFPGGVPPCTIFLIYLKNLIQIAEAPQKSENASSLLPGLCLIGLAAYFEAFCKGQFASIVNILPTTLSNLVKRRPEESIKVKDLLHITEKLDYRLGQVMSDEYDFGSAKAINALFHDLIGITPLSARDSKTYARLLSDRNLLVHHGGAYTLKYAYQNLPANEVVSRVHDDQLSVGINELKKYGDFLKLIAAKLTLATHRSLLSFVTANDLALDSQRRDAIELMLTDLSD